MSYFRQIVCCFIVFFLFSCAGDNPISAQTYNLSIAWQQHSLVCIAEEGGYPRMKRLGDGSLLVAYENRKGDVLIKKSIDGGVTWSNPVIAFTGFDVIDNENGRSAKVNIANPEIIQLPDNDILLACNFRPDKDEAYPFSIAIKRSRDNGKTWGEEQIVYRAAPRFIDGCWEPSFLLLPDGRIQLYFANENPYRQSNEQEISMIESGDNGLTWSSEITTVSFRAGFRDGMPVPATDGKDIYVAVEDNGNEQFKPFIVKNSIKDNWKEPVLAHSSNRYSALKVPLPSSVYAGAPYLIRTSEGVYVLSFQTTENRTSNWELSTMEVAISDKPSDFISPSQPFTVPLNKEAKWNSLCDLGNREIAAVSSTNFRSDKIGIWMIKGKIVKNEN
ncbi:MAG TPA: sialidase family protein [Dysgonamonadaceae bacterium]|mgnify:FL=1|nr:exo-alpha-sialidase [Dysgonamonadaceae bacterium]HOM63778.1 sialidase family protein [Dysgonamonadaceae bacterium]HOT65424.1 sialidase family protein [Dysgonamonadaceae bacterium]HOV35631.1 sialidase family protein [Dysgonamonadaceae bacterium]HPD44066.1 sialidase family protein [Dysgonamonadaceae bacterium]